MQSSVKHVDFLDQLRGVAILAVLLFHTLAHVYGVDELPWTGWFRGFSVPESLLWLFPMCSFGRLGVAIFFVVSGFCIHLTFHQQGQNWRNFFIRRFFRIYPPYLAALIFSILVILTYSHLDFYSGELWLQWLTHLFLVHNLSPQTVININGPFWSLAVEAQLYLIYPLLILLVAKIGWHRTMFIAAGCEILIRGADALVQTLDLTNTLGGEISWLLSFSPFGYWFSWAIGAVIAEALLNNQPLPFRNSSAASWLAVAFASYFLKPLYAFQFLFFAMATATIISRLLIRPKPDLAFSAFSLAVLKQIGLWSYSIYLLHQPLLNIFTLVVVWLIPGGNLPSPIMFLLIVATWLGIILISFLWYKLFELPAIGLGKQIIHTIIAGDKIKPDRSRLQPVNNRQAHLTVKRRYVLLMISTLLATTGGSLWISAKLTPPEPLENNNRAWALATNPDPAKRDGALAVILAEDACRRTQYKQTIMVGTLAAAYAEAERFDAAIFTAQQACELAAKNGETNLLQINQELLGLYQNHKPYRDQQADIHK